MEKKILIAVDDSTNSRKAIEYAVTMQSVIRESRYILFNVQPTISDYLLHDAHLNKRSRKALNDLMKENRQVSERLLDNFKDLMAGRGIKYEHIETVTYPRVMGTAKDIMSFARQNLCNAILLGRRGVSKLEEVFMGSVSNTIIEHTKTMPVWAVGGDITSTKLMLAIDGSESALRAVDHVSFMVTQNPDITVTLLHVAPKLRDYCTIEFNEEGEIVEELISSGYIQCGDCFYLHAKQRFKEAGIKESQIEIKEIPSVVNIAKTILNEAENGGYGTIVLGRSGISDSFFLGSVSRYCFNNASNCAVWIVP